MDSSNNTIVYDKKIYDQATNKWPDGKPSAQDAYKSYGDLTVIQDKKTFVSVSIEHYYIYRSKMGKHYIKEINESMRSLFSQAEKSIVFK